METEAFKDMMGGLFSAMEKETAETYRAILEARDWTPKDISDPEDLDLFLVRPFEDFMEQVIKTTISPNREVIFILTNLHAVDWSFKKMIVRLEGMPCSADKSRTIVRRLVHFYRKGEEIEFDYNGEYTYHLPKRYFRTHEEIIPFFKAIHSAHYGDYMPMIKEYAKIAKVKEDLDRECEAGRHVEREHEGRKYCEICRNYIDGREV